MIVFGAFKCHLTLDARSVIHAANNDLRIFTWMYGFIIMCSLNQPFKDNLK